MTSSPSELGQSSHYCYRSVLDEASGDYYYANEATQETSWDRPTVEHAAPGAAANDGEGSPSSSASSDLPEGWFSAIDETSVEKCECPRLPLSLLLTALTTSCALTRIIK